MATQQAPWATGRHKPRPGRKRSTSGVWGNTQKAWGQVTRKHPWVNLFLQIMLGLVAVVSLVLGAVLETGLYYLVIALAGLGALAIQRAKQMEQTRQGAPTKPRPTAGGPKAPSSPSSSNPKPSAGGLKCTATGRSLEGDNPCDCHTRHVRQQSNADKLGYPLGHPYGKRKAAS